MNRRPFALLGVIGLGVLSCAGALALGDHSWNDADLVARAQEDVRRLLPAGDAPIFLDQPDARTDIHATGRQDLRAVCGWLLTRQRGTAETEPRFFYVLYQNGLTGITRQTAFIQSTPNEMSPDGGEAWCSKPPLEKR